MRRSVNSAQRHHRRRRAPLDGDERDEHAQPAAISPPVPARPARQPAGGGWVRALSPTSTSPTAAVSSAMPAKSSGAPRCSLRPIDAGQHGGDDRQRRDADRQVHEEHRAPADVVGQEAADQRPGDEAEAHQPGERALQRGAAPAGEEVGDEDERQPLQRARAEALQPAPRDQLRSSSCAVADSAEPVRNSTMPISSSARRPWRSDSRA